VAICLTALIVLPAQAGATTKAAWFEGAVIARHVTPPTLWLSADGVLVVQQMRWSSWGPRVARGTGQAQYHGCTPSCGGAQVHYAVVAVTLSDVIACGQHRYYNKITLTKPNGTTLSSGGGQWAPCR
jgi:hypothetical protein